jgi:hypothetical protein
MLEVTDDSGFLALVVPATYQSFVASDWTLDQILTHFKKQMARRCLLIWGTGLEGFWGVDVRLKQTHAKGIRQIKGPLEVVGKSLLLTNYESLTMAAQFEHVTLPEKHQSDLLVSLPNGNYSCTITQMFDPAQQQLVGGGKPDFVVEILKTHDPLAPWECIPWFSLDR